MSRDKGTRVDGGAYYQRRRPGGPLERIGPTLGDVVPDVWICRRVADYRTGLPAGAACAACTDCGATIAYNPARVDVPPTTPKVCMQCASIEPLPFP